MVAKRSDCRKHLATLVDLQTKVANEEHHQRFAEAGRSPIDQRLRLCFDCSSAIEHSLGLDKPKQPFGLPLLNQHQAYLMHLIAIATTQLALHQQPCLDQRWDLDWLLQVRFLRWDSVLLVARARLD